MTICLQGSFKAPTKLMDPMCELLEDRHHYYAHSPPMSVTLSVSGHGKHPLKLHFFLNDAAFEDSPSGVPCPPSSLQVTAAKIVNVSCSRPCLLLPVP